MIDHVSYQVSTNVTEAVNTRRSLRAFLPDSVPQETIKTLLEKAARAPSGTNMQPWKTYVLTGARQQQLCREVCAAFDERSKDKYTGEVPYYPKRWFEPYQSRRRQVGWELYGLLGLGKGDRAGMHTQHRRNFQFFDAPVGMMFTIHRDLATGSWLDYGMYLQNIMLLAREQGLHSCPQAAWSGYHTVIRDVLSLDADEIVVCGMALGYADPDAVENTLVTERASFEQTVSFLE
ncbi:nitroreductase [Granulosicoccus antarcticus]|uniref:Nitroreductase NfnB n=1 Tax=Granulosicoccus antarcticus IMCC3135 TaxID=1192854 RepID=A0A2Z2NMM5_9GAMM|nr:nitroreductase [Granulosicoccus antarcticus]ASJ71211.1 Nitroreductase NfnB [Granulosicoccus antarcticus IMCC3135]